ncbi:hypothetical protein [Aliarcobacter butzleri]|uniref:hypothetical protein n=1 Tax=Aliarcobacter butzleri TaxID=28197 RepID=UPI00062E44C1|nr:hypothetical protein [Aliarcobacter butzleri]KLD98291.1 hypothetical protein AF74_03470 [Aliarcobacter butzleri L349]
MDFKERISLVNEEELKDKVKIYFSTAYVELVGGEYNFYIPEDDMKEGHDCYTDEPLYTLKDNQFFAIVIKCKIYEDLIDNDILDIESDDCVLFPERNEDDDRYLFLFQDFYNFQYERSKIYSFIDIQ